MLKYFNNFSTSPRFSLKAEYYGPSGSKAPTGAYPNRKVSFEGPSAILLKLDIDNIGTDIGSIAAFNLLMTICGYGTSGTCAIYPIAKSVFDKGIFNSFSWGRDHLIDEVDFSIGRDAYSNDIPAHIKFDLTRYLAKATATSTSKTFYFGIYINCSVDVLEIEDSLKKDAAITGMLSIVKGMDSSYEYDQFDVGNAGTGSINLCSGELIHIVDLAKTDDEKNPCALSIAFSDSSPSCGFGANVAHNHFKKVEIVKDSSNEIGTINVIDNTGKETVYMRAEKADIKSRYSITPDAPWSGIYFMPLTSAEYLCLKDDKTALIIVDKAGNKVTMGSFSSGSYVVTGYAFADGGKLALSYDGNGLAKIENGKGEHIDLSYSAGKVSEVIAYNSRGACISVARIAYDGENISSVYFRIESNSNQASIARFVWSGGRLSSIEDTTNGIAVAVEHAGGKVSKIIRKYIGSPEYNQPTIYDYFAYQTRVTCFDGNFVDYFFDYYGRCKSIVDDEGKSMVRNYAHSADEGNMSEVSSESKVQINERNLIENNSFDSGSDDFFTNSEWILEKGNASSFKAIDGGVYGQRCLRIEKGTDDIVFSQEIKDPNAGVYAFSAFAKAVGNVKAKQITLKLDLSYDEEESYQVRGNSSGSTTTETKTVSKANSYEISNDIDGTFPWRALDGNPVEIPGGSKISNLKLKLTITLTGGEYTAYLDDIHLSYGDHKVRYNFVRNGYFEDDGAGWDLTGAYVTDNPHAEAFSKALGNKVLKLGQDSIKDTATQTINMSGDAGDELVFTLFGHTLATQNDEFTATVTLHYKNGDSKDYRFEFDSNFEKWQVLTRGIIAENEYDKVIIEIAADTGNPCYVDAVQLYRDNFGKRYSYTEKKSMTELVGDDGKASNITYGEDGEVTEATDESGDSYRYTFDRYKRVSQIASNQNTKVAFTYDASGKKNYTFLTSRDGENLVTHAEHDTYGNEISQTDDSGNTTTFSYDEHNKNCSKTDANGAVTDYVYDQRGELTSQATKGSDGATSKVDYGYDRRGNLTSMKCDNGTTYGFEYSGDQQIKTVTVNGKIFSKTVYTNKVNGVNTGLPTRQYLSGDDSSGCYSFGYDSKRRLSSIKLDGNSIASYIYNEKDEICELDDAVNGIKTYFSYDGNGNATRVCDTDNNVFRYSYDNLGNLQKESVFAFGMAMGYDYEYKCEYNDYTPSGYLTRLSRAFPDEVIKGGSGFDACFGGKYTLSTSFADAIDVEDKSPLGDAVASLSFKKDNAIICYQTDSFNTKRNEKSTAKNYFSRYSWENDFNRVRKTVFGWIKPTGEINGEQRVFAFARGEIDKIGFSLSVNPDGKLTFLDQFTGGNHSITTANSIEKGVWNLVGFEIEKGNGQFNVKVILNGEVKEETYASNGYFDYLKYFLVGAPSQALSQDELHKISSTSGASDTEEHPVNMAFRLAYASVGSSKISKEEFAAIFSEGVKYLRENNVIDGASGVTYFNPEKLKGFDVVSLNGSLTSLKGMEPKSHVSIEKSYKNSKPGMFFFDDKGENAVHRHVYGSYSSIASLTPGISSKLSYDLLLKNQGTIGIRFKIDELSSDQVILSSKDDQGTEKLGLHIANGNILLISGTKLEDTDFKVTAGTWHQIAVSFGGGKVSICLDGQSKDIAAPEFSLDGCETAIGCRIGPGGVASNHLEGTLEMLVFSNSKCDTKTVTDSISSVSVRTYYDSIGRTSEKRIYADDKALTKKLTYAKNGTYTTTRVGSENDYSENTIGYTYDSMGNATDVVTKDKDGKAVSTKKYAYDSLSRLISSNVDGTKHTYTYDSNNNILTKDGIGYTYDAALKDRLVSRSDGTTIEYKDAFIGNPTLIAFPDKRIEMTWAGRRLATASGYTYSYDPNGLRLSKTDGKRTERYIYDGDSICAMKVDDENGSNTIFFHYDEANALVGFSVNGKDYFYDRDILGNINAVIDSTGTKLVSYAYGDFGEVTETIADIDEARLAAKVNPFKFKGYFFDNETGFYYLKSRYYSPELGRFISADGEIGQVGNTMGMNLFAYCKNNPINLSDEGGNWPSWATKLCIGLAVIAICAIAVVATGGFGASCIATSMLVGAVKGAVIGAVTGAVTGAIQGAITEGIKTGSWEGALKGALSGAIDGAADGFMFGAIGGAISGAINPSYCFIAGTMVMTAVGMKRIEEIKRGDTVLAYDDNTSRYEEMPVTDTYINETEELVEINVGDETITCTPGHSFLTTKGWKKAGDLTDKDILKTLGDDQKITEVIKKKLNSKIKVYNLNVMSCHTYAVGKIGVIVHNKCSGSYELDFDNGKKYIGKGTERRMRVSINRIEKQYGVKCIRSDWTPAKTSRDGFLQEYQRMMNAEFNPSKNGLKCKDSADMEFYNIINSPGLKIWLGLK